MLDMQKKLTKPFFALMALPATAMGFALSIQIAALSALMRSKYDLNIEEVGIVWAAGPIAGILGQVIIGLISDKVWFWGGRRRPFIIVGGIMSALALMALPNIGLISSTLGLADIVGVALTVALVLDLSINVSFNPTRSVISDLTPEGEARTRGYTWMQTVSGAFGMLAYAIGRFAGNEFLIYFGVGLVVLFTLLPSLLMEEPSEIQGTDGHAGGFDLKLILIGTLPLWGVFAYDVIAFVAALIDRGMVGGDGATGRFGWLFRWLIDLAQWARGTYADEWFCGGVTVLLMGWVLFFKKPNARAGKDDLTEFQKIMAAHSFSWLGIQTMFVFYYPYLEHVMPDGGNRLWDGVTNLSFLVLNGVAALLPAFVLNPLAKKMPRVRLQSACLGIMALGYAAAFVLGTSPFTLYIIMAVLGIGWAAVVSLPFAIMSQRINQSRMGLFMGIFNLSVVLPQLLASLGVGLFLHRVEDKSLLFVIAAASLGLSALLWLRVKPLPEAQRIEASSNTNDKPQETKPVEPAAEGH